MWIQNWKLCGSTTSLVWIFLHFSFFVLYSISPCIMNWLHHLWTFFLDIVGVNFIKEFLRCFLLRWYYLPNPTFHSLSYVISHDAMLFQKLLHTSQFVTCIAIELKRFIIFPWSCFWQRGVSSPFLGFQVSLALLKSIQRDLWNQASSCMLLGS